MFNFTPAGVSKVMIWKTDKDYDAFQIEALSKPPENLVVWEAVLSSLDFGERMVFLTLCLIISTFAIIGNLGVLIVILRRLQKNFIMCSFTEWYLKAFRQQRILFKLCLFSLAMSDLMFVVANMLNYATKLSRQTSQLWVRKSRFYV